MLFISHFLFYHFPFYQTPKYFWSNSYFSLLKTLWIADFWFISLTTPHAFLKIKYAHLFTTFTHFTQHLETTNLISVSVIFFLIAHISENTFGFNASSLNIASACISLTKASHKWIFNVLPWEAGAVNIINNNAVYHCTGLYTPEGPEFLYSLIHKPGNLPQHVTRFLK